MRIHVSRWVWGLAAAVGVVSITLAALAMACGSDEHGLADTTGAPEGSPRTGAAEETPSTIETPGVGEGGAGTPIAIPPQALKEETERAVQLLREEGIEVSVPSLAQIVAKPAESDYIRYWSAVALGGLEDRSASAALSELLEDENPDLRYAAVISLGRLRVGSAVPRLREVLKDPDAAVRSVAVEALSYIGGAEAVAALAEKVADVEEAQEAIRYEAAVRLGRMMAEGAETALLNALDDESLLVREGAAVALADLGNRAAIPVLVDVLEDESATDSQVVDSIQGLKKLTGLDFGYPKPYFAPATAEEKAEAIGKWIDWWESQ